MAQQHQRHSGMLGSGMAVQRPEIVYAGPPAVTLAEEAKVLFALAGLAVTAVVIRIHRIAGSVQRFREARISAGMLGQSMGNLHQTLARSGGKPAIGKQLKSISGAQSESLGLQIEPQGFQLWQFWPRLAGTMLAILSPVPPVPCNLLPAFGTLVPSHAPHSDPPIVLAVIPTRTVPSSQGSCIFLYPDALRSE